MTRKNMVVSNKKRAQTPKFRLMPKLRYVMKHLPENAHDFFHSWNLVKLLIAFEVLVNIFVIRNVSFTDIDWSTYMIQVQKIFGGTKYNFNYTQIEGPTGPLVYPAGHVYLYYAMNLITEGGSNVQLAQYIFLGIYIAHLVTVYMIYSHKRVIKVPPYVFIFMCLTSYRIHSLYVLRLFNDTLAVFFAYVSFYAFLRKRYTLSAFLFSFAASIKMNILLYAPAYALIHYEETGLIKSIKNALIAVTVQVMLASPFLIQDPLGYLGGAFDFGRIFLHQWTVNWRFLDEKTFTSPAFFKTLLMIHVIFLFLMFWSRWLNSLTLGLTRFRGRFDDPILTLFVANFIGVSCSRSLHYQFYVWYYHSLPMILWATRYNVGTKMLILGLIEFSWNQYPSTKFSSIILHASHAFILIGLFLRHFRSVPTAIKGRNSSKKKR